ncbi:MAG TPA: hypothetical protein ENO05_02635 [Bacteroides sp.]|nr:hypothetical protein [Bacteroides sp.]
MKELRVASLEAWRVWLRENRDTSEGVWLVFRKKGTGPIPFTYDEALDEALCQGWVDSLIKAIDDREYMRKFTPRKETSNWSEVNKKKAGKLIAQGRMTPRGMALVEAAKKNGMWDRKAERPAISEEIPAALLEAIRESPAAREHYDEIPRSQQRQFHIWINSARREETVQKRVQETIRLLERGEGPGLR